MSAARPPIEILQECMRSTSTIRNVCILAHVDHGKTTIADSLLATNRLVSKRMAGSVRYLDDRLDEQERGITMKSSAVSLLNLVLDPETGQEKPLLLNIIDTPGHIDFSTEVSAALRVCDGALIVVDLVEGVCVQTRESIRQAFAEHCKMILLLNKFDKLITELHRDVGDIFQCVLRAIEDCNAIIAELFQYEYPDSPVDIEDSGLLFSPETGNVIFASAIDGWGFTTKQISQIFVGLIKNESVHSLGVKLWNFDAYVDAKSNTIKTGAIDKNKTNLFTQLCLKTIHHIYSTIIIQMHKDKVGAIAEKLKIKTVTREMNHTDPKVQLRAIMQAWSPLADVILQQCLTIVKPPSKISEEKIKYLLDYNRFAEDEFQKECLDNLVKLFKNCSNETPCISYVSKMFCVDKRNLSQNKPKIFIPRKKDCMDVVDSELDKTEINADNSEQQDDENYAIIALARVFTGTLKVGQQIFVLPKTHTPTVDDIKIPPVTIKGLYMLFGRELVLVDEITSGNICGIGGLESSIVRTATLSNILTSVPFVELPAVPPIVRNAIEPVNPKDLQVLRRGLRILMQSDSCVQVLIQETGEHVLMTAGDVHLAKCLEDLTSKFAQIEINVSSPMVSLRETVTHKSEGDLKKDFDNSATVEIGNLKLTIVAVGLPAVVAEDLEKNYKLLHAIEEHQMITGFELSSKREKNLALRQPEVKKFKNDSLNASMQIIKENLSTNFASCGNVWTTTLDKIWSVGRMSDSINLLVNDTDYSRNIFETLNESDVRSCYDHLIVNAFNNCCKSGPLCEEPLKNCTFFVKQFDVIDLDGGYDASSTKATVNVESLLSTSFRDAFERQQQRLMEPMFTTSIQVNTNILGKVYSVVNKRHGRVLDAVGMDEQEKSFLVKAQIPVVESVGFANEMRKTTSGQAIPSLRFSHFEVIDGDPFYVAEEADEDDEEEGVNVEAAVRATRLRREIRRRKGLYVEEQVVVHAEKQRTLNKKK